MITPVIPLEVLATPYRYCEWDNYPFIPERSASKYCSDNCKKEALKEQKRNYRNEYYRQHKKAHILSQVGTTTLSVTPSIDYEREAQIIRNELMRIKFSTTRYKGIPKKSIFEYRFNYDSNIIEYGDPQPLGIQNTHNYSNFNDYVSTSNDLILKQDYKGRGCPECNNTTQFHKDRKRSEISCMNCGLVLIGPPIMGIVYPWKVIPMIVECEQCHNTFEYDAERNCYEPFQCPDCNHINYVFDW